MIDINIYFLLQKYFRVKFYDVQVGAKFDVINRYIYW